MKTHEKLGWKVGDILVVRNNKSMSAAIGNKALIKGFQYSSPHTDRDVEWVNIKWLPNQLDQYNEKLLQSNGAYPFYHFTNTSLGLNKNYEIY